MHTSPSHLSLFLPVGCRRIETEEKEGRREIETVLQVEGGERKVSLPAVSLSHVLASRVIACKERGGRSDTASSQPVTLVGGTNGSGMMYFRSWRIVREDD